MKSCNNVVVSNISEQSITTLKGKSPPKIQNKPKLISMPKIFSVKGMKVLLPIFVLVVCALLVMKCLPYSKSEASSKTDVSNVSYTSSLEYISILEEKLTKVLSRINGAGKTSVMISIDSRPILTIAKNEEVKTVSSSGGSTTTTTYEPIYSTINGKSNPLIIGETLPNIKGVIVVSSGARDIRVKLDIINAVKTALNVSSDIIDVFIGG